jgi:3-oxoadipate enol-lactonase
VRTRCRDIEVAWSEWGSGEPLLLVHGLGEDRRSWRRVLPWLTLHRRVLAYDLRGHGETSLGGAAGTLQQLGDDLVAFLDALDLERVDLCGFSLGGSVALRVAIDRPERVRALLPVSTSSRVGRAAAAWYEERAQLAEEGPDRLYPVLYRDTCELLARTPREIDDHWLIRREATADPRGFAAACRALLELHHQPLDPDLGRIRARTLVVSGGGDPLCPPRAGEALATAIPGAQLKVITGSGHQIPLERPDVLSALILRFLGSG